MSLGTLVGYPSSVNRLGLNDLDGLLVLEGVTSIFLDWFGPVGWSPMGPFDRVGPNTRGERYSSNQSVVSTQFEIQPVRNTRTGHLPR